jgi:hypothetical protein
VLQKESHWTLWSFWTCDILGRAVEQETIMISSDN